MKKNRRPAERSVQEKLKAVIEFEGLEGEKQGEYLRREGLHSDHIAGWKKSMEAGLESGRVGLSAVSRSEWAADKKRIKELEGDVRRKDRALAETTALLVLKKKADLIWGSGENE
jgi:transposase